MLTSSLDVLHILWCRLVCRNSVKLNLAKTGLKSKFGVNPYFFSWAMSVHNEIPGDNARASFLVHQVPRASATVWQVSPNVNAVFPPCLSVRVHLSVDNC